MFRSHVCMLHATTLALWMVIYFASFVNGGTCWRTYDPNWGTCRTFLRIVSSQKQCCTGNGVAYTTKTITNAGLFRLKVTRPEGMPKCIPCSSIEGDICAGIECSHDRVCVSLKGQPRCVCQPDCSDVELDAAVCGSNGVTYSDECYLRMEKCEQMLETEVSYPGPCRGSCEEVDCMGRRCIEDSDGLPRCMNCSEGCFKYEVDGPVCGQDGITYESQCHLRLTSCAEGVAIPKRHSGLCEGTSNCSTVRCLQGKVCAMENGPHCSECHLGDCSFLPAYPICGSDNITYANMCSLKRAICHSRRFIAKNYNGQCTNIMVTPVSIERAFRKYVCRYGRREDAMPYSYDELGGRC